VSSAISKPARQTVAQRHGQRAPVAGDRNRLARTIRELADSGTVRKLVADLAASRRDCRDRQREIDLLFAENTRLLAALPASAAQADQDLAGARMDVEQRSARIGARESCTR
jgi:hypothetical protein